MHPGPQFPLSPAAAGTVGGAIAAAIVAGLAWRLRALSATGMIAAVAVGTCAAAANWRWAALLVFFFATSSALSPIGGALKRERTQGRIEKPGARDAVQVLANGGVFAAGAVLSSVFPNALVAAASLGALAGAAGDTWATELGLISSQVPRLITSLQPVPAGTSGGITITGSLAGCVGACTIAGAAFILGIDRGCAVPIALGGIAGMAADSLLGATLQALRRCDRCGAFTERLVHDCGSATRLERGCRWIDNDAVNALATVAGAVVAAGLALGLAAGSTV